jgi:hypothetical protein
MKIGVNVVFGRIRNTVAIQYCNIIPEFLCGQTKENNGFDDGGCKHL